MKTSQSSRETTLLLLNPNKIRYNTSIFTKDKQLAFESGMGGSVSQTRSVAYGIINIPWVECTMKYAQ